MERSEAELFRAFEADVSDMTQDITVLASELDSRFRDDYNQKWGAAVAYDALRMCHVNETEVAAIGNALVERMQRMWPMLPNRPELEDILMVEVARDELFYETFDEEDETFAMHELRAGQKLSGQFKGLVALMYMPENYLERATNRDGELDLADVVHPLGLHLIFDHTVVDQLDDDDYVPNAEEYVYVPIHHSALQLMKLNDVGA